MALFDNEWKCPKCQKWNFNEFFCKNCNNPSDPEILKKILKK